MAGTKTKCLDSMIYFYIVFSDGKDIYIYVLILYSRLYIYEYIRLYLTCLFNP